MEGSILKSSNRLDKKSAGNPYLVLYLISDRIPDIWPNIRPDTRIRPSIIYI